MAFFNSTKSPKCFGLGLVIALGFGVGCGKKKNDNASSAQGPTLSGQLSVGFTLRGQALGGYELADNTTVDAIWAIPVSGVSMDSSALTQKYVIELADDGSFSFNPTTAGISGENDYIFALVNSAACNKEYTPGTASAAEHSARRDCITGYVSLPDMENNVKSTDPDGNMNAFPFTKLKEDIDLGEMNKITEENSGSKGDAQADTSLADEEQKFTVDLASLRTIAKTDSMLRHFKNLYANSNNDNTVEVKQNIAYKWFLSPAQTANGLAAIKNKMAVPSVDGTKYPSFTGFHTYLRTNVNVDAYPVENQGSGQLIKVVPPGEVGFCSTDGSDCGTRTFSPTSPYIANWPVAKANDTYSATADNSLAMYAYDIDQQGHFFGAITEMIDGVSPAGFWKFYMNPSRTGNITDSHFLGQFDMSLAEPFGVDANGNSDVTKPVVFYPTIKATVTNDIVTKVKVVFHEYVNGAFVEADQELTYSLIKNPYVFLEGLGCELEEGDNHGALSFQTQEVTLPTTKEFGFPGTSAGNCSIGNIAVTYNISGIDFAFHW